MGTKSGLTLSSETYQEKDKTWSIKITAIWDDNRFPTEDFFDKGYLDEATANDMMVIKTNQVKDLMEKNFG